MILAFAKPVVFDFPAFEEATRKAAHRLRQIGLEIVGRIEGSEGKWELAIEETGQRVAAELGAKPPPSGRARIRGVVERWESPVLKVESVDPAP